MLIFNCIYINDNQQYLTFINNIDIKTNKHIFIIDYNEIITKLTKNDICLQEPSNEVVSFYILKKLKKIESLKYNEKYIYYVINNFKSIKNIKRIVSTITNEYIFNLYYNDSSSINSINIFNNIYNINDDQTLKEI